MAHELPERLDVSVSLDGEPLEGALVHLRLPIGTGPTTGYGLVLGPTDGDGELAITGSDIERMARPEPGTGLLAEGLDNWNRHLVLTPLDRDAIRRAEAGRSLWDETVPQAHRPEFIVQAHALAARLAASPGRLLTAYATATGSAVGIACRGMRA
jgi:hypothetical protein